jgi:hypothetical protein
MCLSQPFRKAKTRFRQVTPSPGIAAAEARSLRTQPDYVGRPSTQPSPPAISSLPAGTTGRPPATGFTSSAAAPAGQLEVPDVSALAHHREPPLPAAATPSPPARGLSVISPSVPLAARR